MLYLFCTLGQSLVFLLWNLDVMKVVYLVKVFLSRCLETIK